jgi:transposase InsO family protein
LLDGSSRYIVHWKIREQVLEADVEIILQRAKEKFPDARPRIISYNGPQLIAKDFKEFIRISGMTHVRTSPFIHNLKASWKDFTRRSRINASIPGFLFLFTMPKGLWESTSGHQVISGLALNFQNWLLVSAIGRTCLCTIASLTRLDSSPSQVV